MYWPLSIGFFFFLRTRKATGFKKCTRAIHFFLQKTNFDISQVKSHDYGLVDEMECKRETFSTASVTHCLRGTVGRRYAEMLIEMEDKKKRVYVRVLSLWLNFFCFWSSAIGFFIAVKRQQRHCNAKRCIDEKKKATDKSLLWSF